MFKNVKIEFSEGRISYLRDIGKFDPENNKQHKTDKNW